MDRKHPRRLKLEKTASRAIIINSFSPKAVGEGAISPRHRRPCDATASLVPSSHRRRSKWARIGRSACIVALAAPESSQLCRRCIDIQPRRQAMRRRQAQTRVCDNQSRQEAERPSQPSLRLAERGDRPPDPRLTQSPGGQRALGGKNSAGVRWQGLSGKVAMQGLVLGF